MHGAAAIARRAETAKLKRDVANLEQTLRYLVDVIKGLESQIEYLERLLLG